MDASSSASLAETNVFETLRGKRLALRQWMGLHGSDPGKRGKCIADSIKMPPAKSMTRTSTRTEFWTDIPTHDEPLPPSMLWTSQLPAS